LKTVNSLSGGKTSSYIAAHYPADIDVFALVCIDDHNANAGSKTFKVDQHVRQMVNDKLQKYCSHENEFLATAEDPIIIKTMFELEQHIGREIIWVRGPGFQSSSFGKSMLPNKKHRWCTTMWKIEPIFKFLFMYHGLPVKMRIGYRADEADRADTFKDTFIYSTHCEFVYQSMGDKVPGNMKSVMLPYTSKRGTVNPDFYKGSSHPHRHRWQEIPFRIGEFPLIEAGITQNDVQRYWQDKNVTFATDSNCQFCFWKKAMQIRTNYDQNKSIILAAAVVEDMQDSTLRSDFSMREIKDIAPQLELFGHKQAGCHGGYCTS